MNSLQNPQPLTPPESIVQLSGAEAQMMVSINDEQLQAIEQQVAVLIQRIVTHDVDDEGFTTQIETIHKLGNHEIRQTASLSDHFLERPLKAIGEYGIFSETSSVSASLEDLRQTIETLDPAKQEDLLGPRKLFGFIPFGNRLTGYFQKYQRAQRRIQEILQSLKQHQNELKRDNAAVEVEKSRLWQTINRLEQQITLGKRIDAELEKNLPEITIQNPAKAQLIQQHILFSARRKVQDLLTQLAVALQGHQALEMMRKNNLELIKGIDRAATTTLNALRTAVLVAQALNNQQLTLNQLNELDNTTGLLMQRAAGWPDQVIPDIHTLNLAFEDIYACMDELTNYRNSVHDNVQQTVNILTTSVEQSQLMTHRR